MIEEPRSHISMELYLKESKNLIILRNPQTGENRHTLANRTARHSRLHRTMRDVTRSEYSSYSEAASAGMFVRPNSGPAPQGPKGFGRRSNVAILFSCKPQ